MSVILIAKFDDLPDEVVVAACLHPIAGPELLVKQTGGPVPAMQIEMPLPLIHVEFSDHPHGWSCESCRASFIEQVWRALQPVRCREVSVRGSTRDMYPLPEVVA